MQENTGNLTPRPDSSAQHLLSYTLNIFPLVYIYQTVYFDKIWIL